MTKFKEGNREAEKHTLKEWENIFLSMLLMAQENEDHLCLQDVYIHAKISKSTFYYLCETHYVLDSLKSDMMDAIISRVNKKTLKSEFAAAPGIWRMKQLGEKDQAYMEQNVNSNNKTIIEVQTKEEAKIVEDLKKKFDSE